MTITDKPTLQYLQRILVHQKDYLMKAKGNNMFPFSHSLYFQSEMAETDRLLNMVREELNDNCLSSAGEQLRPMPEANG